MFVLLVWATLACVLKADAQPVTTIYSFMKGPANPRSGLTPGRDGNFYGTTEFGGQNNEGTVFKMTTNGIMTTLVNFNGYGNGSWPVANLTLGSDGNFYGTTIGGGTNTSGNNASGTVFRMATNGTVKVLVNFNGVNGGGPQAGLALGPDGNFYGTTEFGGTNGDGTVFQMTTNGTLRTLVNFNGTNGANPLASLTTGAGGILYGTTKYGGTNGNYGTVFTVTTNGTFITLLQFSGTNGAWPYGGVTVGPDGNLYGTTGWGGNPNGDFSGGSIFELTTNGVLTTLIRLADFGGANGQNPYAGLMVGPDGNFYGTTYGGGANGNGTVFQVTTNGTLAMLARIPGIQVQTLFTPQGYEYYTTNNWVTDAEVFNGTLTTLYSFSAQTNSINADGFQPQASLTLGPDGSFYGTAYAGGANGYGTAFKVTTNGTYWTLASLSGNNGDNPLDPLTPGPNGSLYGTANTGGTSGYGTVFKLTIDGAITTLVNFDRANDGANPQAGLIVGPGGNFYGTAVGGGSNLLNLGGNNYEAVSDGTVFELTTNGVLTVLTDFNGTDGANPYGGLALGLDGNLYGTTTYGGISNDGTIFQLMTNGTLTTLTYFNGANGVNPFAGLTLGTDGIFYGTSEAGGTYNDGTVFQVTTNGAFTTLVHFNGTNGANPNAGLLLGRDGNFYGTAWGGGTGNGGTVFKVTTGGMLTTLVNFAQTNGEFPVGGLALGPDGDFYGTTELGGVLANAGTVFKMTTNGTLTTLYDFVYSSTSPNGNYPFAGLTLATNGNFIHFYGTTYQGGSGGGGTVFRLNLTTAYAVAENSTNTFFPLTNEVAWTTGGTLSLVDAAATNGTVQITGSGVVFTPAANFTGTANLSYTVTNNAGGTNYSLITVLVTNVPPVANPDFYSVAENSSSNVFSPLANDQLGTSGGALSLVSVSPTNGTAVISGTNVLFTPSPNFLGTATIGYTVTDNVGGTNSSLITITVSNSSADLSLSASASPEPVEVGSNLVYSITVSNAGPSAATGVVVSNQIPAGVTFVSATGGATPSNEVLFVSLGALAQGATNLVQIIVQPTSPGQFTNVFQAFADQTDPNLTNNTATVVSLVTNSVANSADLSLTASALPFPNVYKGSNLVFSITVSNAGPSMATGVVVSNLIPTGVTFVSATGGSTPNNDVLLVNLGSLPVGATNLIQIVEESPTVIGYFTNVFQVFANETDADLTNNSATAVILAYATTNTDSTAEYETNVATTVNEQVNNYSTELIAKLPDGTVVFDQTLNGAFASAIVQTAILTAAGDLTGAGDPSYTGPTQTSSWQTTNSVSVTITNSTSTNYVIGTKEWIGPVTINVGSFGVVSGYTFDSVVTNYALPTGGNPQSFALLPGNIDFDTMTLSLVTIEQVTTNTSIYTNSAVYVMTGIVAEADLSLTASAAPNPVGVGSNLVYSITVSNALLPQRAISSHFLSPPATDVTLSNWIPANCTFVSATGGGVPTNGLLLINLGPLAEGATISAQVIVQPSVAGQLTNIFTVFADQTDPVPTNNSATVVSTVTNAPVAATSPGTPIAWTNPGGSEIFTYALVIGGKPRPIEVGEYGGSAATTSQPGDIVLLTDPTGGNNPTNWAAVARFFNPADPTGSNGLAATSSQAFFPTNASPNNGFAGFQLLPVVFYLPEGTVTTNGGITNIITRYAEVGPAGGILAGQTNEVTLTVSPQTIALAITSPTAGQQVSNQACTVTGTTVIGDGVVTVTNVYVQLNHGGWMSATNTILTPAARVALGDAWANWSVKVTLTSGSNTVQAYAVDTYGNASPTNSVTFDYVTNSPPLQVDVALSLLAAPNPVSVGAPLTYSLSVTNRSVNPATGVVVSNTLPPNVIFVSALPSQGSATNESGLVTYFVGTLPNGEAATMAIVVIPNAAGPLTNKATVYSTQADSVPANNSVTNVTAAVSVAATNLSLTVISPITLNLQTGLFDEWVRVSNGGPATPSWVRVLVSGLASNTRLWNASGKTNGVPYVQSSAPLGIGNHVDLLLEYYVPTRILARNFTLTVQGGPAARISAATAPAANINRATLLASGGPNFEFSVTPGRIYAVQYSQDLKTWRTALPALSAATNQVEWTDVGPPTTDASPNQQHARYYRVVLLPAY